MSHAITRSAESIASKCFNAAGGFAEHIVQTLSTWQQRQMERDILASLDERMLRDIGLTRTDVWRETMKPFWKE